jgi:hypothetical protein
VPTQLQKDLELVRLRLLDCREPRELDVWLHSALRVARAINPYLAPDDAGAVWTRIAASPCYGSLHEFQRRWLELHRAVARRDAARMAQLASLLLGTQHELRNDAREFLLMAGMAGHAASGAREQALELWRMHSAALGKAAGAPVFRLLRCHAAADCAAAFAGYTER